MIVRVRGSSTIAPQLTLRFLFFFPLQQEEAKLFIKVATRHDLAEGFQLISTPGWATLVAILRETGERPFKRQLQADHVSGRSLFPPGGHGSVFVADDDDDNFTVGDGLAKRFKGISLNK